MATESSESEEEGKIRGGNETLIVDDNLREMGKKAAWSVSSCKPGNGVSSLRDDNLDTYWQLLQKPTTWSLYSALSLSLSRSLKSRILFSVFNSRSDGAQPHLVNIQFQKKVKLQVRYYGFFRLWSNHFRLLCLLWMKIWAFFVWLKLVVLYVDFKLDESYTPSKISIRAGDGFHNMKVCNLALSSESRYHW